ncbi:TraB/GumN family protein [Methylobacillus sp.]|uniref:TraB/GumN family protein n=1 Tax=Methylobacillus sp. TaxID=56818 RepID=UPI00257B011F|nr:TraB/GumN family protein [Methylobacillus sp.]
MLWKVQAGHGPVSYLFGTIHVDDPRVTALAEPVNAALESVQSFMMEVLPSNDVSPYYMQGSLAQLLTEAELEQVYAAADFHGLPRDMALRMKPWLLAMVFDLPVSQSPYTLDVQLYLQAQRAGKAVEALETPEAHFSVLESISLEEQMLILRSVLKRSQEQREKDFELMIQAYLSGNLDKVGALDSALGVDGLPAGLWEKIRVKLLDERNMRMAERIAAAASLQPVFVAVGAAHLPGEGGLIDLLSRAGFTVSPVNSQ